MNKGMSRVSKAYDRQRLYDDNIATIRHYQLLPVSNLVHKAADSFPHKPAINIYGTEMTFSELRFNMLCMASALTRLGIIKGDLVGLALPNSPQYIIAYYAVLSLGAIVVNLNPFIHNHNELKIMLDKTAIKALIAIDSSLPAIRPLVKEAGIEFVIVSKLTDFINEFHVSTRQDLDLDDRWYHFSELLIQYSNKINLPQVITTPQDPAMIQFTGGTTSIPKGVVLSHGNIMAAVCQFSQWSASLLRFKRDENFKVVSALPYFDIFGNIICMSSSLFNITTQILLPLFDANEFINIIGRYKEALFFPIVPSLIKDIIIHPQGNNFIEHGPIRWIHSEGAPMPLSIIRHLQELGLLYSEGWGMTETAASGIYNPFYENKQGPGGVPMVDTDLRLVNIMDGKREVKQGEPGEIIIKGPNVTREYWNNLVMTTDHIRDGWLYTGDIAKFDSQGYFHFLARKEDVIIADGVNIYPREVNDVLMGHPLVIEAASLGVPDTCHGEIVSFVVLKQSERTTEKDILDYCKSKLTSCKVPKMIEFRESLPKSAMGRIQLRILRNEAKAITRKDG
jgi:long-chain acyl-CoA synthetase